MASATTVAHGTTLPADAPQKHQGDTQTLLAQLDACVDRIRSHISDEPYITTIPQDEPKFHHYSRFAADAWLINTPFDPAENYQVQYQTFFYREPYSDIYERVRCSHFDRSSRPPPPPAAAAALLPRSATNTPSLGPKKKISLAAYKSKQANAGTSTPANAIQSVNSKPSSPKAVAVATALQNVNETDGKKIGAKTNTIDDKPNLDFAPRPESPQRHLLQQDQTFKRKQPASDQSTPPKKSRMSASLSPKTAPSFPQQSPPAQPLPMSRLSPLDSLYLPGRLSPTLPPQIIAALDGRRSPSASDSSLESDEPLKNVMRRPSSKHDSVLSQVNDLTSDPVKLTVPTAKGRRSLVVVLKISKKHRASFRRLVQFTGRTVKDRKPDTATQNADISSKARMKLEEDRRKVDDKADMSKVASTTKTSVASKTGRNDHLSAPSSSSASKRPRPTDDVQAELQAKRKNPPSSLTLDQNPVTPLQPPFRSPAFPVGANRSSQATPTHRKDTRGPSAMQRVESSDGFNPSSPAVHDRTPASKTTSTGQHPVGSNVRPSPIASATKTPESHAWAAEFVRLSGVAKELKHAAPEHSIGAASSTSARERKLAETAALSLLESLLAFILAFSCNDKSYTTRNPSQIPEPHNWISCHAFWRQVKRRCQPYPHLAGVVAYLGAVYNGIILDRLSSSSSTKTDPKHLLESAGAAVKAAEEAALKLPLTVIKAEYPQTWRAGWSGLSSTGGVRKEHVSTPGHYEGGFALDVGIHSDPFEGVRFAHSLLTEWCAKSKEGEYTLKLKLSV